MRSSEATPDLTETNVEGPLTIQQPIYALLAVYIPLSILAGLLPSLNFLLMLLFGPVPVFPWFCSGLLSGTIASIYWAIVKKSKADHTAANIRGAILVVAGIYCLGSFMRPGRLALGERFFPSLENLPSGIIALFTWFAVLFVKRVFEGQELIASYTRIYEGEKLRQIMLEDSSLTSDADLDIKKLIARYRAFFFPSFLLFIVSGILGMPLSAILAAALAFLFLTGVCIVAFLGLLRKEYAYAAEGLAFASRPKALLAGLIVILASAALGLLLSSGRSLLPFNIIIALIMRLLAFLDSLFTGKPAEMLSFQEAAPLQQMQGLPPEFAEMMGESAPSPFWNYVKSLAIGLVVFLFGLFMINPLLNRSGLFRGAGSLPKKAVAFLAAWFKALALGFKRLFSLLGEGAGGRKIPDSAVLRGIVEDVLEGYSAAKKRDIRRSAGLFARLIYWGVDVMRVNWKPSHAPLEYCALLAAAVNSAGADQYSPATDNSGLIHAVHRAGALFDKALYSAAPLTRSERDEFKALVEMVTAT